MFSILMTLTLFYNTVRCDSIHNENTNTNYLSENYPTTVTVLPTGTHTSTIFFFHGATSNNVRVKGQVDTVNHGELRFPNTKIIYPLAPLQEYTIFNGTKQRIWYDRLSRSVKDPEARGSIDSIMKSTTGMIKQEVALGIPLKKIVVAGLSMGGGLSLYLAYQSELSDLAGCAAFSSVLNENSQLYKVLKENPDKRRPPLLQSHGTADVFVPFEWAENTFKNLTKLGVHGEFISVPGAKHVLTEPGIIRFKQWVSEILR